MSGSIGSHVLVAGVAAALGACATFTFTTGLLDFATARAQTPAPVALGSTQTELFKTTMQDVLGRVVTIRVTERDPGNSSGPHRHPGSHTFGYVLEGNYEVKIDDGPLQKLGPGGVFYEQPNALHAISRNGSQTQKAKYIIFSISDPTKPQTVQEK
jgi:quercetin dioxygenase-like cupin family protein